MPGRASTQAALGTRRSILRAAADLASAEGLDSVTIGRLADRLQMSKSGVVGQFGSKEKLQIETVQLVADDFRTRVWEPVRRFAPGLPRLLAACEAWVEYSADPGYAGGCLLTQATFDYDGRSGPVHDLVAERRERWREVLRSDLIEAVRVGQLPADSDVAQLVYGLEALAAGITPARLLHGDERADEVALGAMHRFLGITPARPTE